MKECKKRVFHSIIKLIYSISIICVTGGFMGMLVVLLSRSKTNFTGAEVFYDKINLTLFNTVVLNGVIVLVIALFLYNAFTEWRFREYPFMIIDAVLLFVIFWVGYLRTGFAISGMASISDAGFHTGEMADQYLKFWNQAEVSLWINLGLIVVALFISYIKPFGKREKVTYKRRKMAIIITAVVLSVGIGFFISSEVTLFSTRGLSIEDIDMQNIPDGEYKGHSEYSSSSINVIVTVKNHKITEIKDPSPSSSVFTKYASGVFNKIMDKQTPNVDAISGATTSSKAYMKAVEDALKGK